MEFYETTRGRLGFREMPSILADMLRQIPRSGERECDEAEARLFPPPSEEADEDSLREDWKAHVQPGLHELFQSARQTVEADLRALKEEDGAFALEFPKKHAEPWLNALNQARLSIAAQNDFGEQELSRTGPLEIQSQRDLNLLQMNFYAAIQQWLLEAIEV